MVAHVDVDGLAVKQLAEILNDTGLSEIEYENKGCRIRVVKASQSMFVNAPPMPGNFNGVNPFPFMGGSPQNSGYPASPVDQTMPTTATTPIVSGVPVRSPMVGTVYMAGEPGAAPFVKVGDRIEAGQTLLIIEAMKVMNPLKATQSGIIKEILVMDATPVEYDETLLIIE